MVSSSLQEQLFLPLLFWAEVLCELEERGSRTDKAWIPSLCAVDAEGLRPGCQLGIPAVTWSKAPPWQDEDLLHVPCS